MKTREEIAERNRISSLKWYYANYDRARKKTRDARVNRREWINTLKDNPCLDCGGRFPSECMDFDHVLGTKIYGIGTMVSYKPSLLNEELKKCELVCANCHRIRTKKRRNEKQKLGIYSLPINGPK